MKLFAALAIFCSIVLVGCSAFRSGTGGPPMPPSPTALDRFLFQIKTQQISQVVTQHHIDYITITNNLPVYLERPVYVTQTVDVGTVLITTNIQVITNYQTFVETAHYTNYIVLTNQLERYEYEPKESIKEGAGTIGTIVNTFTPGVGGLISTALVGALGIWARLRSRKANIALVQSVETARQIIDQIKSDPNLPQRFKDFLIDHQREEGVFELISGLVKKYNDKPAAKEDAAEILQFPLPPTPPLQYRPTRA